MTLGELLLVLAGVLAALSGAIFTIVFCNLRPRPRRGSRHQLARVAPSPSALRTPIPGRSGEDLSLSFHSPRTGNGVVDRSVADVEDGLWVRGAEVSPI